METFQKRFSKKTVILKFLLPLFILALAAIAVLIVLSHRKSFTVVDNGLACEYTTFKTSLSEALDEHDIVVGDNDSISVPLSSVLEDNQSIIIKRAVPITISEGSKTSVISSSCDSVQDLLDSQNITLGEMDKISPEPSTLLEEDMKITIKRAVPVTIIDAGKSTVISTPCDSVQELLDNQNIKLGEMDRLSPEPSTLLKEDMKIKIVRVKVETKSTTHTVPFGEKVTSVSSLPNTKRYIKTNGQDGQKTITTKVTYEDGKEVKREIVSDKVTKAPVTQVVVQGTYPLMPVSRSGNVLPHKKIIPVRSTAYWAVNGVGKTYTASGRLAVRNPNGYSTVAVDTSVIPFGTKLFIEGYGFAIAADRGTAIIGNKVDVYFNTKKEACNWAVKYVKVYVLS